MSGPRWLRLGMKALHDIASMGFGGALAACIVINLVAQPASATEFAAGRQMFAAIAQCVLIPSMAVVLISGLIALAATRGYRDAGWAWFKALLGMAVLQATLAVVGSSRRHADIVAATTDPALLEALLRAERNTLWLLIVLSVVNVVLAVWRPSLLVKVR